MFIKRLLHNAESSRVHFGSSRGYYRSRDKSRQVPASCLRTGQLHMQLCHQPVMGKEPQGELCFLSVLHEEKKEEEEGCFCLPTVNRRREVRLWLSSRWVCLREWGWGKEVRYKKKDSWGSSRAGAAQRERKVREQREVTIGRLLIGKPPQAQQAERYYTHWHTNTQARTNTCGWDEAQTNRVPETRHVHDCFRTNDTALSVDSVLFQVSWPHCASLSIHGIFNTLHRRRESETERTVASQITANINRGHMFSCVKNQVWWCGFGASADQGWGLRVCSCVFFFAWESSHVWLFVCSCWRATVAANRNLNHYFFFIFLFFWCHMFAHTHTNQHPLKSL